MYSGKKVINKKEMLTQRANNARFANDVRRIIDVELAQMFQMSLSRDSLETLFLMKIFPHSLFFQSETPTLIMFFDFPRRWLKPSNAIRRVANIKKKV